MRAHDLPQRRDGEQAEQDKQAAQDQTDHDVVSERVPGGNHREGDRGMQLGNASRPVTRPYAIRAEWFGNSKAVGNETDKPHSHGPDHKGAVKRAVETVPLVRDVSGSNGERGHCHPPDQGRAAPWMRHHPPAETRMEVTC
jgi:hypothetical protein